MKFGLKALFVATALLAFLLAAITSVAPKFDREKQQIVVSSWLPMRVVEIGHGEGSICLILYHEDDGVKFKVSGRSPIKYVAIDLYVCTISYDVDQDARPGHKVMWCNFKRRWSDPRRTNRPW